jgi:hypothetical protein
MNALANRAQSWRGNLSDEPGLRQPLIDPIMLASAVAGPALFKALQGVGSSTALQTIPKTFESEVMPDNYHDTFWEGGGNPEYYKANNLKPYTREMAISDNPDSYLTSELHEYARKGSQSAIKELARRNSAGIQ